MVRQLAALLTAAILGISGPAFPLEDQTAGSSVVGQIPDKSRATGESEDPRIGYFISETEDYGFVLDRTGEKGLLRFDQSREILVLDMVPGPQGVTYLKDRLGITILRLMPWGGATVYDADGGEGSAFSLKGLASPLVLDPRSERDVRQRSTEIQLSLVSRFGFDVEFNFESGPTNRGGKQKSLPRQATALASLSLPAAAGQTGDMTGDTIMSAPMSEAGLVLTSPKAERVAVSKSSETLGDALELAALALERLAADELAMEVMSQRITRVTLRIGANPGVSLEDLDLVVTYVPGKGLHGRPSSAEIERFLLENL